jgi:4-hydroxy-L-threonine phosphate dehydrogenase PdxA
MNIKKILIILGEPNSTFSEILLKYFNSKNFKNTSSKIILIGSFDLLSEQIKFLKYKNRLNKILDVNHALKKKINILNVNYKFNKAFSNISDKSNKYIEDCFDLGLKIIKKNKSIVLINGPISKENFLKKKFPGITEYVAKKTNSKDPVMLIYNEKLAVSPLSTHIPINRVSKFVKKTRIINNVIKINNFYKSKIGKKPKIAVLGLNPHCESINKISEEKNEIIPAVKYLFKNKINISGPIAADTFFLDKNIRKFDVVIGMYHAFH